MNGLHAMIECFVDIRTRVAYGVVENIPERNVITEPQFFKKGISPDLY